MSAMEDEIRELIKDSFGSIPKFAKVIKMSPQTIYSVLNNKITRASMKTVMPIAAGLRIDPFLLMEGKVEKLSDGERGYVDVPLYGSISAGEATEPIVAEEMFPIPAELGDAYPSSFVLKVSGESMNRTLPNGCYALVHPCDAIDAPGHPYAVCIGASEATIKCVKPLENGIELTPDSTDPTFKAQVFDYSDEESEPVTIVGKVVWFCPPLSWQQED